MKKTMILIVMILISACVAPPPQRLEPKVKKKKVKAVPRVRKFDYVETQTQQYQPSTAGNYSCLYRERGSVTCRLKRIQIKLGTLEQNIDGVMGAIGSCESCGR